MADDTFSTPGRYARRGLLKGMAALPLAGMASGMLPGGAFAQSKPPTAQVNTTGLAVTDDTVTVGILHSVTEIGRAHV